MALKQKDDAHEVALEWLKQIITLSSGIIVLSATFISTIFNQINWSFWLLVSSWLSFLVSIIFALETISVITQSRIEGNQEWSKGHGRIYAKIAKWLFMAGIFLFIIFALFNFLMTTTENKISCSRLLHCV